MEQEKIDSLKIILILLILWLVFAYSFTPLRTDSDAWWHLKTGKYIVEHNFKLPLNDVFTFTGEHIRWVNHEWLTQILFYLVFYAGELANLGGLRTLIAFKTLVLIVTALMVLYTAYRRSGNFYFAAVFTLITAAIMRRTIYPRPPIITYLLLAIFLFLLYEYRAKRINTLRMFLISIPLMVLWVNLHGGFVLAFIVLAFFIVDAAVNRSLRGNYAEWRAFVINLLALFGSLFVASLINPYGLHPHLLTFKVMGKKELVRIIPELQSPDFFFTWSYEFLLIFFMIGFAVLRRRIPSLFELLLLVFFTHQSIMHVRHLPLFGIITAPLATWLAAALVEEFRIPPKLVKYFCLLVALIFVGWGVFHQREGMSYFARNLALIKGEEFSKSSYPMEVCDFIIANKFTGNMYNQINYAGYLIWRLSPEYHKIFTDSRFDIWLDRFVWDEKIIEGGIERNAPGKNWYDLLEKYNINFIVITRDAHLNYVLKDNPNWRLVYYWLQPYSASQFAGWNIYIKNVPENQTLIERCERSFESLRRLRQYLAPSALHHEEN